MFYIFIILITLYADHADMKIKYNQNVVFFSNY